MDTITSVDDFLRQVFRLEHFRPHQREVIDDVLSGSDVVCVMPTGAGKSLCFQLPALLLKGLTVVVSPLISLMADQVRQLQGLGVPVLLLNSSQESHEQSQTLNILRKGFEGLLYLAPERFAAPSFQRVLPQLRTRLLVVDEAHCLSFWGHDFRREYMRLAEVREQLGSPTTMALTATATPAVRNDIVRMLKLRSPKLHVTGFDRPNLTYACRRIDFEDEKDQALLRGLSRQAGSGIVYCATRKKVEYLAAFLRQSLPQRTIRAYHAGMDSESRKQAQQDFMANAGCHGRSHKRVRHGHQQARYPLRRALQHSGQPGSLLSGSRSRGTRRTPSPVRLVLQPRSTGIPRNSSSTKSARTTPP